MMKEKFWKYFGQNVLNFGNLLTLIRLGLIDWLLGTWKTV